MVKAKKVSLKDLGSVVPVIPAIDEVTVESLQDGRVSIRLKRDRPNRWGDVIKSGETFTGKVVNGRVRFDYYPCESLILEISGSEFLEYFEIVGPVKPVKPSNSDDYSGPTEGYAVSVSRGSPITEGRFEPGDGGSWQEYEACHEIKYVKRKTSWNVKGGCASTWVYALKDSLGRLKWYPLGGIVGLFNTEAEALACVNASPKTQMFFNMHSGRGCASGEGSGEGFRDTTMWGT
jgi:hypothetical protein